MNKKILTLLLGALAAWLLTGCAMRTVEEMYALPRRSAEYSQLQTAIDAAMEDLTYSAPISGDNQQSVQTADLDGDGVDEYLVFAAGDSENPLQVLIFTEDSDGTCRLTEVIQSNGTAFEQVEYVNFDEKPGYELVIGRQISDQVLRSVSVYSFSGGSATQLLSIGYSKFLTCDLDENGRSELMVLRPGDGASEQGMAMLYSTQAGQIVRSVETELSEEPSQIRRIVSGTLEDGSPAVYVISQAEEDSLITDIFALREEKFSNISFSSADNASVQTLCSNAVYPEDMDGDGVLELPGLVSMKAVSPWPEGAQKFLLRWFSLDVQGNQTDKLYTFHYYSGGWYILLEEEWAPRVSVAQSGGVYTFYVWDADYIGATELFTLYVFTGSNRDEDAVEGGRFALYRAEGIAYAGKLSEYAADYGITESSLTEAFCLIRQDW